MIFSSIFILILCDNIYANQDDVIFTDTEYYYSVERMGAKFNKKWVEYNYKDLFLYSVNPYISTSSDYSQINYDDFCVYDTKKEKILLYSYFGFNGIDRYDIKYKLATQILIWEEMLDDSNIYFWKYNESGEKMVIDVSSEISEIISLVEDYLAIPNISLKYDIPINLETVIAFDRFNEFEFCSDNNINVDYDSSGLKILPIVKGNYNLTLKKKKKKNESLFFRSDKDLLLFSSGTITDVNLDINLNVYDGGYVELNLSDSDIKYGTERERNFNNSSYGIYDADTDVLIDTIYIDNNGYGKSNVIRELGNYYILENNSSYGYIKNEQCYFFEYNSYDMNFKFEIEKNADFKKVILNFQNLNSNLIQNDNFIIGLYSSNGNLISESKINDSGTVEFFIPYGIYDISLVSSMYYDFFDNIFLNIDSYSNNLEFDINLEKLNSTLFVNNVGLNDSSLIKNVDFQYKIYNIDTDEWVCISDNCIFTSKKGIIEIPNLDYGNYYLYEIYNDYYGYFYNKDAILININKNTVNDDKYEFNIIHDKIFGQFSGEIYFEDAHRTDLEEYIRDKSADIYIYDTNNNLINVIYSDNGFFEFKLPLGDYYYKKGTVDGYLIDNNEYYFSIEYIDSKTQFVNFVTIINYDLVGGNLLIEKNNYNNDNVLKIYNLFGELIEYFDPAIDTSVMYKLPVGTYYISDDEDFTRYFDVEFNSVFNIDLSLYRITDVPSTGMDSFNYLYIIAGIISVFLIFHEKKD